RCLEKDPDNRWQTARDLCYELRWIEEGATKPGSLQPLVQVQRRVLFTRWALVVALALVVLTAAAWLMKPAPRSSDATVAHLMAALPRDLQIHYLQGGVAVSPDGTRLAFSARTADGLPQLYIRPLRSPEVKLLPGTDGANSPFFSPDGRWIGFFA